MRESQLSKQTASFLRIVGDMRVIAKHNACWGLEDPLIQQRVHIKALTVYAETIGLVEAEIEQAKNIGAYLGKLDHTQDLQSLTKELEELGLLTKNTG